jgi:ABC-type lipoprotein export system ATPase subunit
VNVAEVRDGFRIYDAADGGVAALRGLDLVVRDGEIVVVLGPSGCGKSTLLRVLAGLDRLSAGRAHVLGLDLGRAERGRIRALRSGALGLLDQHYARSLSADLTCGQTIAQQPGLLGADPAGAAHAARRLLRRVGLADRIDERPAALSGGEQQRVAVCAALAHRPSLLLADEPAGELDAENARTTYALIEELVRAARGAAVIVSHDPAAAEIADRLVYLEDGRVVEEESRAKPRALVVANGWLRLPDPLLHELGRPRRIAARRNGGKLLLAPAAGEEPVAAEATHHRPAAPPGTAAVARLRDVTKRYGSRVVLDGVDALFRPGELTAFVGRSGSGKTTLLHLLAGLERPTSGEVEVAGARLGPLARSELADLRRRAIALVTQEPGLVPSLTALENVRLGLQIRRHGADPAAEALEAVGLGPRLDLPVARLSAGERQRVALARALASDAPLLLADEPTARLDRDNALRAARLLADAARERGLAVVCATHDPVLIERADLVIPLDGAGDPRRRAEAFTLGRRSSPREAG